MAAYRCLIFRLLLSPAERRSPTIWSTISRFNAGQREPLSQAAAHVILGRTDVAQNSGAFLSLQTLARALGGEVSSGQVRCPGPNHSAQDRSLSVKLSETAPDGFLTHSFAGDDVNACRDYVRAKA